MAVDSGSVLLVHVMADPSPSRTPDSFRSLSDVEEYPNDGSSTDDHFSDAPEGPPGAEEEPECTAQSTSTAAPAAQTPIAAPIPQTTPTNLASPPHYDLPGTAVPSPRSAVASSSDTCLAHPHSPNFATSIPQRPHPQPQLRAAIPSGDPSTHKNCDSDVPRMEIPITAVERSDDPPTHVEVSATDTGERRSADAAPDVIRLSPKPSLDAVPVIGVRRESETPLYREVPGTEADEMTVEGAEVDVVAGNEEESGVTRMVGTEREEIEGLGQETEGVRGASPARSRVGIVSGMEEKMGESKSAEVNGIPAEDRMGETNAEETEKLSETSQKTTDDFRDSELSPESKNITPETVESSETPNGEASNGISPPTSTTATTTAPSPTTPPEPPTPSSLTPSLKSSTPQRRISSAFLHSSLAPIALAEYNPDEDGETAIDDNNFGDDDFDDFGEVVEGEDFDDFEGFEEAENAPAPAVEPLPPAAPTLSVPIIDFGEARQGMGDNVQQLMAQAVGKMFPASEAEPKPLSPAEEKAFFTERSLSLWNQLVAPPPLQPANWKLSRIRRLFLVSLGVPVDLDEILPPETKAKKLILPSTLPIPSSRSSSRRSRSKDPHPHPIKEIGPEALDVPSARILCSTSDVALSGFTLQELRDHVKKLEEITNVASEVLTYWLKKRESAIGDKETFETVIESLVGYARKKRGNG